jgi:hypothetical protein
MPSSNSSCLEALTGKQCGLFSSQNIAEFWNVATRPADVSGLGFSHREVLQEISSIESLLTLLPDIPTIYLVWKQLVRDYGVQRVKVYDARLVAVVSVYAVDRILAFNVADFQRYGSINALQPAAVLA